MARALYVGGLDNAVTLDLLRAAFLPFGTVKDIQLPLDMAGQHKGFGFVLFQEEGDAEAAIENMEGAELFGHTIRVNFARAGGGGGAGGIGKSVWAEADAWWKNLKAQGKGGVEGEEREGEGEDEESSAKEVEMGSG
jgi:peptidyl-prolyl isomerase E (cyclophilin E)